MEKRGRFIAFEGIDGSGKTTQIAYLMKKLQKLGAKCLETCEPTGLAAGKLLRSALTKQIKLDNRAIAALFVADRVDHLTNEENGLLKTLESGCSVVCDRYCFSSYAYNSVDTDMDWVINANSVCTKLLVPDCTVFLDIDPDTALMRIAQGREASELFETKERLTLVRENYFKAFDIAGKGQRIEVFDGTLTPEQLADKIWAGISDLF